MQPATSSPLFARMYENVAFDRALHPIGFKIASILLLQRVRGLRNDYVEMSVRELMDVTGKRQRTIEAGIKSLERLEYVHKEVVKGFTTRFYLLPKLTGEVVYGGSGSGGSNQTRHHHGLQGDNITDYSASQEAEALQPVEAPATDAASNHLQTLFKAYGHLKHLNAALGFNAIKQIATTNLAIYPLASDGRPDKSQPVLFQSVPLVSEISEAMRAADARLAKGVEDSFIVAGYLTNTVKRIMQRRTMKSETTRKAPAAPTNRFETTHSLCSLINEGTVVHECDFPDPDSWRRWTHPKNGRMIPEGDGFKRHPEWRFYVQDNGDLAAMTLERYERQLRESNRRTTPSTIGELLESAAQEIRP